MVNFLNAEGDCDGRLMKATKESNEDYLEAVLVLEAETGQPVHAVQVARQLDVSKASVSKALVRLESLGLLKVIERDILLSAEGRRLAESVLRRHHFFMRMLEAAGVDTATASAEACRMEHCISEDTFAKLSDYFGGVALGMGGDR